MRALVWFRSDLRIEDNPALCHACRDAEHGVIAVFLIAGHQWRSHDWADIKVNFLLRNLRALSNALAKLNIPLRIETCSRFDKASDTLLQLAKAHECNALYFNVEYEVNERKRDEAVKEAFRMAGCDVCPFHDQTIVRPDILKTSEDRFYTVFTPFKKKWLSHIQTNGLPEPLGKPRKLTAMPCNSSEIPTRVDGFDKSIDRDDLWPAGETAAKKRLAAFIEHRIRGYKKLRDYPCRDATSALSPYLALGIISARQCAAAAREANRLRLSGGRVGPDMWIGELIWREFYRNILVGFPRVSMHRPFRLETESITWNDDDELFDAWRNGRTGFPIVDAAMRQLNETGWMHNRLRMIAAMFLTKDLFIDWRKGEQYFMRTLVDGDLASNNGGWQWSSSTGTDAAPYFRIFNPFSQSRKFDPTGEFIRRYVPELQALDDSEIHEPSARVDLFDGSLNYPKPIVDHAKARRRAIDVFKSLKT